MHCVHASEKNSLLRAAPLLAAVSGAWGRTLPPVEQQLSLAGLARFSGHVSLPTHNFASHSQILKQHKALLHRVSVCVQSEVREGGIKVACS